MRLKTQTGSVQRNASVDRFCSLRLRSLLATAPEADPICSLIDTINEALRHEKSIQALYLQWATVSSMYSAVDHKTSLIVEQSDAKRMGKRRVVQLSNR